MQLAWSLYMSSALGGSAADGLDVVHSIFAAVCNNDAYAQYVKNCCAIGQAGEV